MLFLIKYTSSNFTFNILILNKPDTMKIKACVLILSIVYSPQGHN